MPPPLRRRHAQRRPPRSPRQTARATLAPRVPVSRPRMRSLSVRARLPSSGKRILVLQPALERRRIQPRSAVLRCIHCRLLREIRLGMRCAIRVFPPSCVRLFFVGTTRLAQRRPPTSAPSSTRTSQTTTTATASRRPCRAARPSLAPPHRRSSGTRLGPTRPSRTSRDASSIRTPRPSPEGGGG